MLIFLTDRKLLGLELTRILSEAGLPVLMERPEAAEYLCRERTVGALLIDGIPNASAARALCNRMRAEYSELQIMLILAQNANADTKADRIIRVAPLREMAEEVLSLCAECGWRPQLSTYSLLVTNDPAETRLLGTAWHSRRASTRFCGLSTSVRLNWFRETNCSPPAFRKARNAPKI